MHRKRIAEELLQAPLDRHGFGPCPGRHLHSAQTGQRDFRVCLDGAPTAYCFHASCMDVVSEFNLTLRRAIWRAERGDLPATPLWGGPVAAEPTAELKKRPPLDRNRVADFIRPAPAVDEQWLVRRSPVDVSAVGNDSRAFLDQLYAPEERVLVFTTQHSQADFLYLVGKGSYRLSSQRGVRAAASLLPRSGPQGIWYLTQPVTGQWAINTKLSIEGEPPKWTRRSEVNVTSWRYFVLESDEPNFEAEWLKVLVMSGLPISAIYTSGGRSIHALVKWQVASKAEWDQSRNIIRQLMCPLGADPAALSAVRLSRLPGCRRGDRLQKLLWLDPDPKIAPLALATEVR